MNSTEWWSPEPGNTPKRRRISNRTRLFSITSSFDQYSAGDTFVHFIAAGGSIQIVLGRGALGIVHQRVQLGEPVVSPLTRSDVASGKWLTPPSTGSRSCIPQSRAGSGST